MVYRSNILLYLRATKVLIEALRTIINCNTGAFHNNLGNDDE